MNVKMFGVFCVASMHQFLLLVATNWTDCYDALKYGKTAS